MAASALHKFITFQEDSKDSFVYRGYVLYAFRPKSIRDNIASLLCERYKYNFSADFDYTRNPWYIVLTSDCVIATIPVGTKISIIAPPSEELDRKCRALSELYEAELIAQLELQAAQAKCNKVSTDVGSTRSQIRNLWAHSNGVLSHEAVNTLVNQRTISWRAKHKLDIQITAVPSVQFNSVRLGIDAVVRKAYKGSLHTYDNKRTGGIDPRSEGYAEYLKSCRDKLQLRCFDPCTVGSLRVSFSEELRLALGTMCYSWYCSMSVPTGYFDATHADDIKAVLDRIFV